MHRHEHVVTARQKRSVWPNNIVRQKLPDQRERLTREAQLPAYPHRQQPTDCSEEEASKKVLEPDHLVIVRPNVLTDKSNLVMSPRGVFGHLKSFGGGLKSG